MTFLLLVLMAPGCALPESYRRVNAHAVRDTHIVAQRYPEDVEARKAAQATFAMATFTGKPKTPVHPDQLDEDIRALERDSSWLGRLLAAVPSWFTKAGTVLGYAGLAATLLWGGNWVGARRALNGALSVFTQAIQDHGNGQLRKAVGKATMGTRLGMAIGKRVKRLDADQAPASEPAAPP